MPSRSLQHWRSDRLPRLAEVDAQCDASLAATPPNPALADENLRGYTLLLSAHFQGFCRDLHTECAQFIVTKVRPTLQLLIQDQFVARRFLDAGNPNLDNLKGDFNRFGFNLAVLLATDPGNALRLEHLRKLNTWRNVAAHHGTPAAAAGPLTLPALRAWRGSCDGLATGLDGIMYNVLRQICRRRPW